MTQTIKMAAVSAVTTMLVGSIVFMVATVLAAPTQAPPNGNPTFPLQGAPGTPGAPGAQGPQGPAGTFAPGSCQVCVEICDFNGAGPCSQTCDVEGGSWSAGVLLPGDVDGNDRLRVRLECT